MSRLVEMWEQLPHEVREAENYSQAKELIKGWQRNSVFLE